MKAFFAVSGVLLTMFLSGCGGGSNTTLVSADMQINKVTFSDVGYRKTATITVTGQNLLKGISARIPGCLTPIVESAGSTNTQKVLTCKLISVGTFTSTFYALDGVLLYSLPVTVSLPKQPQVTLKTTLGDIVVELNPFSAPISVNNFLDYVESGFYTNKIFHRVIANSLIQGGGYTSDLTAGTTKTPISLEAGNGLSNTRGTIAMARTDSPDSATSQFYFNVIDNSAAFNQNLTTSPVQYGYAVFGKIVTGLDVLDKISVVPTTTVNSFANVPTTPVVINSAVQTQ